MPKQSRKEKNYHRKLIHWPLPQFTNINDDIPNQFGTGQFSKKLSNLWTLDFDIDQGILSMEPTCPPVPTMYISAVRDRVQSSMSIEKGNR